MIVSGYKSEVQGEARVHHVKGGWSPNVPYKAAWGSWGSFIKLKYMEHVMHSVKLPMPP